MWIFDTTDGDPRLLKFRSGHSAPPRLVQQIIFECHMYTKWVYVDIPLVIILCIQNGYMLIYESMVLYVLNVILMERDFAGFMLMGDTFYLLVKIVHYASSLLFSLNTIFTLKMYLKLNI